MNASQTLAGGGTSVSLHAPLAATACHRTRNRTNDPRGRASRRAAAPVREAPDPRAVRASVAGGWPRTSGSAGVVDTWGLLGPRAGAKNSSAGRGTARGPTEGVGLTGTIRRTGGK